MSFLFHRIALRAVSTCAAQVETDLYISTIPLNKSTRRMQISQQRNFSPDLDYFQNLMRTFFPKIHLFFFQRFGPNCAKMPYFAMLKNPSTKFSGLDPGWLCTNVCRTYATTDVVGHNEYRRYDLFTTSVADL